MTEKRFAEFKSALMPLCCFSVLVFFTIPMVVTVENIPDFRGAGIRDFFKFSSLFTFLTALCGALLLFCLGRKAQSFFEEMLYVLCSFIIIWGLYLPLNKGLLDGNNLPAFMWLHCGIGVLGSGLSLFFKNKRNFVILMVTILFSWIYGLLGYSHFGFGSHEVDPVAFHASEEKNVFVIGMDSLEGDTVNHILKKDAKLRAQLDGFISFENTLTPTYFTQLSLAALKSGRLASQITTEDFFDQTKETQITSLLQRHGFTTSAFSKFIENEKDTTLKHPQFWKLNYPGDPYFSATIGSMYRYLPAFFNSELTRNKLTQIAVLFFPPTQDNNHEWQQFYEDTIDKGVVGMYDEKRSLIDLQLFLENLTVSSKKPTAHFHHYLFTHAPQGLDKNCDIVPKEKRPEREVLWVWETHCALKQIGTFVEKLKTLRLYENSQVLFFSDHGQHGSCHSGANLAPGFFSVTPHSCIRAHRGFLLAKKPGSKGPLQFSDFPASLVDIAPTVCRQWLPKQKCQHYDGVNLHQIEDSSRAQKREIWIPQALTSIRDTAELDLFNVGRQTDIYTFFELRDGIQRYPASILATEKGVHRDSYIQSNQEKGTLLHGPFMHLGSGHYKIGLTYAAEGDKSKTGGRFVVQLGNLKKEIPLYGTQGAFNISSVVIGGDNTDSVSLLRSKVLFEGNLSLKVREIYLEQIRSDDTAVAKDPQKP